MKPRVLHAIALMAVMVMGLGGLGGMVGCSPGRAGGRVSRAAGERSGDGGAGRPESGASSSLASGGAVISESLEEVEHRERMEFQARKRKAQAQRAERRRKMAAEALERGRERLRAEQQDQALEAFEEAVKLDQGSADAWIRIAYVCELEGDMEKAAAAFREAKRLWAL